MMSTALRLFAFAAIISSGTAWGGEKGWEETGKPVTATQEPLLSDEHHWSLSDLDAADTAAMGMPGGPCRDWMQYAYDQCRADGGSVVGCALEADLVFWGCVMAR